MKAKASLIILFLFAICKVNAAYNDQNVAAEWDQIGPTIEGERYVQHFEPQNRGIKKQEITAVKKDGLWGFVENSKVKIKPKYQNIGDPIYWSESKNKVLAPEGGWKKIEGMKKVAFPVQLNGKWGLVSQEGKEIMKPQFDEIIGAYTYVSYRPYDGYNRKGLIIVNDGKQIKSVNKIGKNDKDGKNFLNIIKYNGNIVGEIPSLGWRLLRMVTEDNYKEFLEGYDESKQISSVSKFENLYLIEEEKNGRSTYGYTIKEIYVVDKNSGKVYSPDEHGIFGERGKQGLLDGTTIILPMIYKSIYYKPGYYEAGYYLIEDSESKWGVFNKKINHWELRPEYSRIKTYIKPYFLVEESDGVALYKQGMEMSLLKGNFDSIMRASNKDDIILVQNGKKGYYCSRTGKSLEPEYEDVTLSEKGLFKVKDNGRWNELDAQGNKIPNEEDRAEAEARKKAKQIAQIIASKMVGTWKSGTYTWIFRGNGTGEVKIDNSGSYWNDRKYVYVCHFRWKKEADRLKLTYGSSDFNNISHALDAWRAGLDYEEYFKMNPSLQILEFSGSSMELYFNGSYFTLNKVGK